MLKRVTSFAGLILAVVCCSYLGAARSAIAQSDKQGFSDADKDFAKDAAQGGMAEVKLGHLAVDRASSEDIKKFGQKMIDDHSKANAELMTLAQSKSIMLPADDDIGKFQKTYDKLSKLSGEDFDKAYVKAMLEDHTHDVRDFQKQIERGQDSDLKAWASNTLPTIQMHLSMISDIDKAMGGKGAKDKDMGK